MIPIEALKVAVAKEKESKNLYQDLLTQFPALKDTFSFLINEEEKHRKLLEAKMAEMTKY